MFNFLHKKKELVTLPCSTDVHCHILPGVDHGSQDVEMSLEMLRCEKELGINRIICTSHVTAETFENTPETLTKAGEVLKKAIIDAEFDIEIHVSAEYRLDEYWAKEYEVGHVLPMPGNYLMIENSFQQELLELDDIIFDLQVKGYKPILAHPERYGYYAHRHQRYQQLHNAGVKFQLNILSLAGYFGPIARDSALWLVENGLVDMIGTDMHNAEHAHVIMQYIQSKEWRKIVEKIGPNLMNDLIR